VCIFSTGDELVSNYCKRDGCIQDTNSIMIEQILDLDHYEGLVINSGIVKDKYVIFNYNLFQFGVDIFVEVFVHRDKVL